MDANIKSNINLLNFKIILYTILFFNFTGSSAGKEPACNAGDPGSILGSERSTGEGIGYPLQYSWASLVAQLVKKLPVTWKFTLWFGKIPWRRERLPTPVFWPGEFHGQSSLVGYCPWGCKELDITEQLMLSLSFIH